MHSRPVASSSNEDVAFDSSPDSLSKKLSGSRDGTDHLFCDRFSNVHTQMAMISGIKAESNRLTGSTTLTNQGEIEGGLIAISSGVA